MKNFLSLCITGFLTVSVILFMGCEAGLTTNDSEENQNSGFSFSDMYAKIDALQEEVERLKSSNTVAGVSSRVADLENRLEGVTRGENADGYDTITFSGVNVQIVNDLGYTNGVDNHWLTAGTVNGLGNLIVGYNEERSSGANNRTGSHNIVVGSWNNYSSYGGLLAGRYNTISGKYSTVSGGESNTASGDYSSVNGGNNNTASGDYSSVNGGGSNTASGDYSSANGGENNTASEPYSSVGGGAVIIGNYTSCKKILDGGASTGDGIYTIDPDGAGETAPFNVYCDMTIDGGGWTVVAAQNLETPVTAPDGTQYDGNDGWLSNKGHHVHKYHFPPESEVDIPTTILTDETYTRIKNWPSYTEYAAVSLYSRDLGDGSTTSKQWKLSTNGYGTIDTNLIQYIVDNFQGDDPLGIVDNWVDCNSAENNWGLTWFGGSCNTYDHYSQADLMSTLLETDIFQIDTSFKGFTDVSDCGAGWSNSDCRRALASYTRRDEITQKLVIMVRE